MLVKGAPGVLCNISNSILFIILSADKQECRWLHSKRDYYFFKTMKRKYTYLKRRRNVTFETTPFNVSSHPHHDVNMGLFIPPLKLGQGSIITSHISYVFDYLSTVQNHGWFIPSLLIGGVLVLCTIGPPGPLFTKRTDDLPQDLTPQVSKPRDWML